MDLPECVKVLTGTSVMVPSAKSSLRSNLPYFTSLTTYAVTRKFIMVKNSRIPQI